MTSFVYTSKLQVPTLDIKIKYSRLFSCLNVHVLTFFVCCLFFKDVCKYENPSNSTILAKTVEREISALI